MQLYDIPQNCFLCIIILIQSVHFLGAHVNMFIHIAVRVPILWKFNFMSVLAI